MQAKLTYLNNLTTEVSTIQKAHQYHLQQKIELLSAVELERIGEIYKYFALGWNINPFCSASKNLNIEKQVSSLLLGLLNGEGLAEIKQSLVALKQQDKEGMQAVHPVTMVFGGLTVVGVIGCVLMLTLNLALWPVVAIFAAPVTLIFLVGTLFFLKNDRDYRQTVLSRMWENFASAENTECVDKVVAHLTGEDMLLLKKVNSTEWLSKFDKAKLQLEPFKLKHASKPIYTNAEEVVVTSTGIGSLLPTQLLGHSQ